MTWAKVDDRLHRHRKARLAGVEAMGLWVLALSFAVDNRTDGRLDEGDIKALCGLDWRLARRCVDRLVEAGLWERHEGGIVTFHDWAEYQPTSAQLSDKSEKASQSAQARWDAKRNADRMEPDHANRMQNAMLRARDPVPSRPVPSDPSPAGLGGAGGAAPPTQPPPRKSRKGVSNGSRAAAPAPKPAAPGPRPDGWEPLQSHRIKGYEFGFDEQELDDLAEAFANHHDAKGSRFASWDAAFHTWIRNQARFDADKGIERRPLKPPSPRPPRVDQPDLGYPPLTPEQVAKGDEFVAKRSGKPIEVIREERRRTGLGDDGKPIAVAAPAPNGSSPEGGVH